MIDARAPLDLEAAGAAMWGLAAKLWPMRRSLTGDGVRASLRALSPWMELALHEVPSGAAAFDWTVPKEWRLNEAWLKGPDGRVVVDAAARDLHVVGYSTPFEGSLSRAALEPHLYSLPEQPDVIPYVTSYYRERWGFCLSHRQRQALPEGQYQVKIDAELFDGSLTYGEAELPGAEDGLVLVSSYMCHPQMANNELSGPVVAAFLHDQLARRARRYTYRFVIFPETIGSIVYLSRHLEALQSRLVAGLHLSCIGDERAFGMVETRYGETLADRVAGAALAHRPGARRWPFLERGSDERQYQAPGVDLPVVTLCRSKFASYPEYHTSADDLSLVTPQGLAGGLDYALECVETLEANAAYRATVLGEPQLGRRGLYPTTSVKGGASAAKRPLDVYAYCDGRNDIPALCARLGLAPREVMAHLQALARHGLVERLR